MPAYIGERCEKCFKHTVKAVHSDGVPCDQCIPKLQSCKACQLVRYCSRACQKAHWKEHKPCCEVNVGIKIHRELLGPVVAARQMAFEKWCRKNTHIIVHVALNALEIMKDQGRLDTHVFLVYVNAFHPIAALLAGKNKFAYSVKEARVVTVEDVHEMFDWRFPNGYEAMQRTLAPRPGMLKTLVIDEGLPFPLDLYTLPADVDDDVDRAPWKSNWMRILRLTDEVASVD